MPPIFGVASIDQSDGTTYAQAVSRDITNLNIKASFVYYSPSTTPHWSNQAAAYPSDHDLFVSIKKYSSDSQWISDHQTFANEIPSRTGKVYMVCNEEPEPDMSAAEFVRRWNLVRSIWENNPYSVPSVQLSEYTVNPQSGRDWHDYVPSWISHVSWSVFGYLGDVDNSDPTPHYELAGRVITEMQNGGKTFSFSSVGCAAKSTSSADFLTRRAQWCYDQAEDAMLSDARHFMWWDGNLSPYDYRIRTDTELTTKYNDARTAFSSQEGGGRSGPEFRAEAHASANTATLNVTVPSKGIGGSVQPGDRAYLYWSEVNGALITGAAVPAGWTELIAPTQLFGNTMAHAFARRTLVQADIGATINYGTLSASRRQNLTVRVYSTGVHDAVSTVTTGTGTTTPTMPGLTAGGANPKACSFAMVQHVAANSSLVKSQSATNWTDRADFGTSGTVILNGSQYHQDRQLTSATVASTTFKTNFSVTYAAFTVTLLTDASVNLVINNATHANTAGNLGLGVVLLINNATHSTSSDQLVLQFNPPLVFVLFIDPGTHTQQANTLTVEHIHGNLWFTPPHRNQFTPYSSYYLPGYGWQPDPWDGRIHSSIPAPPNLWVQPNGSISIFRTGQDVAVFHGGYIHGPLTDAEITVLVSNGYGPYLHLTPTPPEP